MLRLIDRDVSEVVEMLEDLLRQARNGEVLSVVSAIERPGGVVSYRGTHMRDRYAVIGLLSHMIFTINQSLYDDSQPG